MIPLIHEHFSPKFAAGYAWFFLSLDPDFRASRQQIISTFDHRFWVWNHWFKRCGTLAICRLYSLFASPAFFDLPHPAGDSNNNTTASAIKSLFLSYYLLLQAFITFVWRIYPHYVKLIPMESWLHWPRNQPTVKPAPMKVGYDSCTSCPNKLWGIFMKW